MFQSLFVVVGVPPLLYISILILHRIISQRKFDLDFIRKLNAWRQGYQKII